MKCPKCQHENPEESTYCSKCATPLNLGAAAPASLTKTIATPFQTLSQDSLIAGKYRIVEEIGRGGMGVVFKAKDLKLKRHVALKFLPPHLADSAELKERFLIEAQAAAAFSHPNICVIHEVGEDEGRSFIAMEYVEGETLRDKIKKKSLRAEDPLAIISQVAAGLGEAHRKGIIHRDIKSANIMVTDKGQAKLMDFGLAKLRGESSLTKSQTTLGTVAYMSPEQARGDEVDQRTDLWSLGVILYEMLAGELPFKGDRDLSIIHSIIHEDPRPIKLRKPPVPLELQQVVARALKKKREARYGSAEEMLKDLGNFEVALQAEAAGVFNLPSLLKRLRRPVYAIPSALVIITITSLVVLWIASWLNQPALAFSERDWIVIADVDNQTGDPVFDHSLSTALNVGLSQSQYVNVLPPSRMRDARQRMQLPPTDPLDEMLAAEVAVREGVKAVIACSITQVGSVYQLTARLIDPKTQAPVRTESVLAKTKNDVLPALDELATRVRRNLGESLSTLSKKHLPMPEATTASLDALKLYADWDRDHSSDTSISLLEQAVALDPDFALAHAQLGFTYYLQSDRLQRLKGEEHITRALDLLDRLSFRERLLVTALAEDSRGRREEAVVAYKVYLTSYPDDSDVWFRLGWTYMATLGQAEPAVEAFKRVIAIYPRSSSALINLATSYTGLDQDQEAREAYERAFALRPNEMMGIFVNHEYGFTLVRLGEIDRAAEVFKKMFAEDDPGKRGRGQRSLALLEMYKGHYKDATESFKQAIAIDRANDYPVSEFRDRILLAAALVGRGERRALEENMDRIETLVAKMTLGPGWLHFAVKLFARNGRARQAQSLLEAMVKTVGDATSDSAANRNTQLDQALVNVARGEIALAAGKTDEALEHFEAASQVDTEGSETTHSLATATLAAGRLDDAARHYEKLIAKPDFGAEAQPYWFDAHLRIAEIRLRQGSPSAARALYEGVLAIWKDGDSDLLALQEAKRGLARVK